MTANGTLANLFQPFHYKSEGSFKADLEVLEGLPQYIGPSTLLDKTNSHTTNILDRKMVLFRNKEGAVNALSNVCRHRGATLVAPGSSVGRSLTCPYHCWSYDLDGRLIGTPKIEKSCPRLESLNLPQYQTYEMGGLIFTHIQESPNRDFNSISEIVNHYVAPMVLQEFTFYERRIYHIKCNWKIYMENYLEGYHIPSIHPELAGVLDMSAYSYEDHPWGNLQWGPLQEKDNLYSQQGGNAWYFTFFPNFMLNILPGRMQINRVLPKTAVDCEVVFDYYYSSKDLGQRRNIFEKDVAFSDKVQQQDIEICEDLQQNLSSRCFALGPLSASEEVGVYQFQQFLCQKRNAL